MPLNAPQLEVLERSTACIMHAGLNSTPESLTLGVPLVAIPITNDQPAVAARVEGLEAASQFLPNASPSIVCEPLFNRYSTCHIPLP